ETRVLQSPAASVRAGSESQGGSVRVPARPGTLVLPAHAAPDSQMFPRPPASSRRSLAPLATVYATSGRQSLRRADSHGKESQDPPDTTGSTQGRSLRPCYPSQGRCRPFGVEGRQDV